MTHPDVIILGLGGMGSAAAMALAGRGARVLGLERHGLVHDRGSSHGEVRIIRKAYMEHPDYVPLLVRAYAAWADLEAATGETLFVRQGLLLVGPPEGATIVGTAEAARQHGLPLERLDAAEIRARYPDFQPDPETVGLFEADAGFLRVEACVRAMCAEATRLGADLRPHTVVHSWAPDGDGVVVETDRGRLRAQRLVIAPGAWAPQLLPALAPSLRPQRQMQLWFRTAPDALRQDAGCPVFGFHAFGSFFYGFPTSTPGEAKICEHGGGEAVAQPSALDRELREADLPRVRAFNRQYLRGVSETVLRHAACLYTMSPDEHFVLDLHPEIPQVSLAVGFSGHGFKFAAGVGKILADLVLRGATEAPIGFLSARRAALR